eukprot:3536428-Pyramimonas_sp.AAC.1
MEEDAPDHEAGQCTAILEAVLLGLALGPLLVGHLDQLLPWARALAVDGGRPVLQRRVVLAVPSLVHDAVLVAVDRVGDVLVQEV